LDAETPMKIDREQLREYLLGRMPEEQATVMDRQLFAEDSVHRALEEEQQSLVEDFVYGWLPAEDERAIQLRCRQSSSLQEKVAAFRIFLVALERQAGAAPVRRKLSLSRFFFLLSPALAAMLLITAFLVLQEHRKGAELSSQLQAVSQAPEPPPSAAPNPAPSPAPLASHASRATAVAFLSANVPRDASALPAIDIPKSATLLELQVEVRSASANASAWNVEVLRGDEIVWKAAHLPLHRVGHEAYLSLLLDSASLPAGSYTVRYFSASDPGSIASRDFRVAERSK